MSRNKGKSPKLDVQLTVSPHRRVGGPSMLPADAMDEEIAVGGGGGGSPSRRRYSLSSSSSTTPGTSPPSSCVSSENEHSNSPEAPAMVLAGCPQCLMYVMLSQEDPKCPKCKSTVLLDFLHGDGGANSTAAAKRNKKRF